MADWTYQGESGCEHWAALGYDIAASGEMQSPINISTAAATHNYSKDSTLKVLGIGGCSCKIENTGFTAKVSLDEPKKHMKLDGDSYKLIQFHFHSPSEHTVDNKSGVLELHLVHESTTQAGNLAVLGFVFEVGKPSKFLDKVLDAIPKSKTTKPMHMAKKVHFEGLEMTGPYWRYDGSLTTPPCTEGIKWVVFQHKHHISPQQLQRYTQLFPMDTNRPTQPVHTREVHQCQGIWTYEGETGCKNWAKMGYPIAESGHTQSPINIETAACQPFTGKDSKLSFATLGECTCKVENTGFTAKVLFRTKKKHIMLDGEAYKIVQFHFHSPSEHTVDNESAALELHLVHESLVNPGKLAVIGVMFKVGKPSGFLDQVFEHLPHRVNRAKYLPLKLNLNGLELTGSYWRYDGSLTTPPCSEGVNWILMQKKHEVSPKQLEKYLHLFPMETNRPVQPLNNRKLRDFQVV